MYDWLQACKQGPLPQILKNNVCAETAQFIASIISCRFRAEINLFIENKLNDQYITFDCDLLQCCLNRGRARPKLQRTGANIREVFVFISLCCGTCTYCQHWFTSSSLSLSLSQSLLSLLLLVGMGECTYLGEQFMRSRSCVSLNTVWIQTVCKKNLLYRPHGKVLKIDQP